MPAQNDKVLRNEDRSYALSLKACDGCQRFLFVLDQFIFANGAVEHCSLALMHAHRRSGPCASTVWLPSTSWTKASTVSKDGMSCGDFLCAA